MASGSGNRDAVENSDHMIQMILKEVPEVELRVTQECCIYKIPESLRKSNPEAYTPQLISIGPIHQGNEKLKPMEKQKELYFRLFWNRLSRAHLCHDFWTYKKFLEDKEEQIRNSYSEKYPEISEVRFVNMIWLDAVFIMELFLRKANEYEYRDDYMFEKAWLKKGLIVDLIMLENQLPIFVLDKLYETVVPETVKRPNHPDFVDLAREYFASYDPQTSAKQLIKLKRWKNSIHFTALIRYLFIPLELTYDRPSPGVLKAATKLRKAGISFEPVENKCLLDIKFKRPFLNWFLCLGCIPINFIKARFQLPVLKVDDSTECVVRNVIAFEQCHDPNHPYISNYFSLIGDLIHSKEDVELLVEKEVIVHRLGSDKEMVTLVNKLCTNIVLTSTCYGIITEELNKHYYNKWNRLRAKLRFVYFGDLWRASATVVGLLVLFFAFFNFLRVVLRIR